MILNKERNYDKKARKRNNVGFALKRILDEYPHSDFFEKLSQKFQQQGTLSPKEQQRVNSAAGKINKAKKRRSKLSESTLQSMHDRRRGLKPPLKPLYEPDQGILSKIESILAKYPTHKAVLRLKEKFTKNIPITSPEKIDLETIAKKLLQ